MTTNREEAMVKLQAFARDIMECWPDGDVDGGYLQDVAEKHGLILPTIAYGPCGENACACAEVADFPTKCYSRTPLLLDEIAEPAAEKSQAEPMTGPASIQTPGWLCPACGRSLRRGIQRVRAGLRPR